MDKRRVYLDYAATTPVDRRVLQAMLPYFTEDFGNPSSIHFWGQKAENALERSREIVAEALGATPREVVFTGHGTEADNLAIRGVALTQKKSRGADHLLVSPVEHHAVLQTMLRLQEEHGFEVEFLPVDEFGQVSAQTVAQRLRKNTALVAVVYANNEIGTVNPIAEVGKVCRERGVALLSDGVQAAAHLPVNVRKDNVDLLAIGAHKFYGPKGVGALFLRDGVELQATMTGGKQEFGLRAGTQNIPLIVGLAEALRITRHEMESNTQTVKVLRDRVIEGVLNQIPEAHLTGHPVERLPNHASFVFRGVDGNKLLMFLDAQGYACSSGSACKVGVPKPSEVLTAIGLTPEWALGSLRVTLGRKTTAEDIDGFLNKLPPLVAKLRELN